MSEKSYIRPISFSGGIESRAGLTPGRFTDVNLVFSFMAGLLVSCCTYASVYGISEQYTDFFLYDLFFERGPTPYFITLLSFWALSIILIKSCKVNIQRKALNHNLLPQGADYVLTRDEASRLLSKIQKLVDCPEDTLLVNRVMACLNNYVNLGNTELVSQVHHNQEQADREHVASSYHVLNGFIWAIPVLGFIGTVLGLAQSMKGFGSTLISSGNIAAIKDSLTIVVGGLSTAFDTTLLGLVAAVFLQIFMSLVQRKESKLLDYTSEYCNVHLIYKIKNSESESGTE